MVAFKDIKIIKEDDDALPSKTMTAANLFPRGEMKYVQAIATSIKNGKTFVFKDGGNIERGVIDKISIKATDEKNIDIDDPKLWAEWAEKNARDPDKGPKYVASVTIFNVNGKQFFSKDMFKTSAAVGGLKMNLGDTAEAILGSAITAKFEAGGRDITKEDVLRVLKEVTSKGMIETEADYKESEIQGDKVTFRLTLNAVSLHGLKKWIDDKDPMGNVKDLAIVKQGVNENSAKKIQKNVIDSVGYANNNKRAKIAVDKAKADPNKNEVNVISDGGDATNQSVTKVDLKITYDGQVTRLLSLKAGTVKQFGQVSGATFDVASNFFESVLKLRLPDTMKEEHGWKDSKEPDFKLHNLNNGPFEKMYAQMEKQVKDVTAGDQEVKEYNLVKTVYDGINYHATRGEEGVTMVILSPNAKVAYKELAFDQRLLRALELYDLKVVNEQGLAQHRLSVIGVLKEEKAKQELGTDAKKIDGKAVLVQLSTRMSGGAVRNLVEMGDLLKDLADIEKIEAKEAEQQKQQGIDAMKKAGNAKADAEAGERKMTNDPNAKVQENMMKPTQDFGPNYNIVDDLHVYMRNNQDVYRKQYFPMLCAMQEALKAGKKINAQKIMMPVIKTCVAEYNKKYNLANESSDIFKDEDMKTLCKKVYTEEIPLIKKGVYK